jgi:hypothetical protein
MSEALCEGCLEPLNPVTVATCRSTSRPHVLVCLPCVKARARTACGDHRCHCGKKRRENPELHKAGNRTWHTCFRCLGTTRQLS